VIEAVVFDLDGVIVDSEHVWDAAREALARERDGHWHEQAQKDMMGMSSVEWSRYMHDVVGLKDPPEKISSQVIRSLEATYREELPLIDGAPEAVAGLAQRWPLAVSLDAAEMVAVSWPWRTRILCERLIDHRHRLAYIRGLD
jgi:beta-phosphoglucomutase-like phosphatase (HAD superfamily)